MVFDANSTSVKFRREMERVFGAGGGDAASWLAMQADYDLKTLPTRAEIERRVQPRSELADV